MFAIVLAAGKGQRMRSTRPKVLHELGGRPLLDHVLGAVVHAGIQRIVVVVGPPGGAVELWLRSAHAEALDGGSLTIAHQPEPRGTGHAVECALAALVGGGDPTTVILNGDVPLVRSASLKGLAQRTEEAGAALGFATFVPQDPSGYGRVIRNEHGRVQAIREHRNCDAAQLRIRECNAGLYCARRAVLLREVPKLEPQPPSNEVYLTDLVQRLAIQEEVVTFEIDPVEAAGVNTAEQLLELEGHLGSSRR